MSQFCAICTDDVGPFEVLELDGRTFIACQKCLSEHPARGGHVDQSRGYEPGTSVGGLHVKARKFDRETFGDVSWRENMRTAVVSPNSAAHAREYRRRGEPQLVSRECREGIARDYTGPARKDRVPTDTEVMPENHAALSGGEETFLGDETEWFRKLGAEA